MSRRTVRAVMSRRPASSSPDQSRWVWSRESSASSREDVFRMGSMVAEVADTTCPLPPSGWRTSRSPGRVHRGEEQTMSVTTTTHLNFRGAAREALDFYRSVFGGRTVAVTYKDAGAVRDESEADWVMWGEVTGDDG